MKTLAAKLKPYRYTLYFLLIYGLLFLLLPPRFEFPLNDSWAYAKAAKHFYEHGNIRLTEFAAPSQVFQIVYSGLFIKPFGFSFTGLRISIWILSFFSLVALYNIFRMLGVRDRTAFLCCLLLLFNPIYFSQLYTYMTHTSFISIMILSIFFFGKAMQKEKTVYLVLSSAFAIFCLLIRQQGLILAVAYILTVFIFWTEMKRKAIKTTFLFILPVLGFACFQYWIKNIHGLPIVLQDPWPFNLPGFLSIMHFNRIWRSSFVTLEYLGFFFLPMVVAVAVCRSNWPEFKKADGNRYLLIILAALGFLGVIASYALRRELMPYHPKPHYLYNLGSGPKNLTDVSILGHQVEGEWALSQPVLLAITLLCTFCGAAVVTTVMSSFLAIARKVWLSVKEPARVRIRKYGNAALAGGLLLSGSYALFPMPFASVGQQITGSMLRIVGQNPLLRRLHEKMPELHEILLPLDHLLILFCLAMLVGFNIFYVKARSKGIRDVSNQHEKRQEKSALETAGAIILLFMLAFSIYVFNYDRYLIELYVPAAIVFAAYLEKKKLRQSHIVFALGLLLMAVFSVVAAKDYLSWNKARWEGLQWLMQEQRVEPSRIDGGFEFNGWYTYELVDAPLGQTERHKQGKSWWWIVDDEYVVAFTPIEGYATIRTIPYSRILGTGDGEILVLQRSADRSSHSPHPPGREAPMESGIDLLDAHKQKQEGLRETTAAIGTGSLDGS